MFIYIGLQGTVKRGVELPLLHAYSCCVNKIASDIFTRVKNRLAVTHLHFASWNYHKLTGFRVIIINRNNHLCHFLAIGANILHWCRSCSAWNSCHRLNSRISTLRNVRYKVVPLLAAISLKVSYVAIFRAFILRPLDFRNSHNAIENNYSVKPLIFCKGIRAAAEYTNW